MLMTSPFNAGGTGSIPGLEAKMAYAFQPKKNKKQTIKQTQDCNKSNKDFKLVHIKKIFRKKSELPFSKSKGNLPELPLWTLAWPGSTGPLQGSRSGHAPAQVAAGVDLEPHLARSAAAAQRAAQAAAGPSRRK